MAHTDAGPCFSHELTGLVILSLVTAHSLVTPHMHGPMRRMHPTPSMWLYGLPSVDLWN